MHVPGRNWRGKRQQNGHASKSSYIGRYFIQEKSPVAIDLMATGLIYIGAGEMNRTPDLLITNELLYRLSYTG